VPPRTHYPAALGSAAPTGARAEPSAAGPEGTFHGGYARVIRATDEPARPSSPIRPPTPGQPAGPAGPASPAPADADVFVYRDPSAQPAGPAAHSPARGPAEHDTAYWYDLLAEDAAPGREETRGPFEPLPPSGGASAGPRAGPQGTEPAGPWPGHASPDDTAQARERKLEQLKDLYLTAEAIGEENVTKHFDQILAQQRELISEYFRQSAAARPAGPHRQSGDPGADDTAEQPRAW